MADSAIDFDSADHNQRKAVRIALMDIFRNRRALKMFLDEEMGVVYEDVVEQGTFKEEVYELITILQGRGRLNSLMEKIHASPDHKDARALTLLAGAWTTVTGNTAVAAVASTSNVQPAPSAERLERILDGAARLTPLSALIGIASLRRRVCLLEGSRKATGFLIAPDLLLTTAQVVDPDGSALDAVFDFALDIDGQRKIYPLQPPLALDVKGLGYALIPLEKPAGSDILEDGSVRGWFDLSDPRVRLREKGPVFMLHHPKARALVFSSGNISPQVDKTGRFLHNCETYPGSSGAPIIDEGMRLAGLHEGKSDAKHALPNMAVRADFIQRDLIARGFVLKAPPERAAKGA
jgi:hypothetical protein